MYSSGTLVPVPPQVHPYNLPQLHSVPTRRSSDLDIGISVTSEPFTEAEMPCTVAVTAPFMLVPVRATKCVNSGALGSQPAAFTSDATVGPDWYTSVIEVRHALIPRMNSDILARIV